MLNKEINIIKTTTKPQTNTTPEKPVVPTQEAVARQHRVQAMHPMAVFRHHMDDLFTDFLGLRPWGDQTRFERFVPAISPHVEVTETDDAYRVAAELPGLDEKDVEVLLEDQCLIIRGEKREEKDEKRKNYHLTERRYGTFQRTFTLPPTADAGKIAADFKKGVLNVTIPKLAGAKPGKRQIPVAS